MVKKNKNDDLFEEKLDLDLETEEKEAKISDSLEPDDFDLNETSLTDLVRKGRKPVKTFVTYNGEDVPITIKPLKSSTFFKLTKNNRDLDLNKVILECLLVDGEPVKEKFIKEMQSGLSIVIVNKIFDISGISQDNIDVNL
jgi:hypothetical protein